MTVRQTVDRVGVVRLLTNAMRAVLVGVVLFSIATVRGGLFVNSALPLAVAMVPTVVSRRYDHDVSPLLVLWITAAAFLHAAGALCLYQAFGWYDQVAHGVSSALVAGTGYAVVQAIDQRHDGIEIPGPLRFVFVLIVVLAFGVLWEIMEFATGGLASLVGGQAVLAQYGVDDIVFDLLFNLVGGVIVAIWGTRYFDGVAAFLGRRLSGG